MVRNCSFLFTIFLNKKHILSWNEEKKYWNCCPGPSNRPRLQIELHPNKLPFTNSRTEAITIPQLIKNRAQTAKNTEEECRGVRLPFHWEENLDIDLIAATKVQIQSYLIKWKFLSFDGLNKSFTKLTK